VPTYSEGPFRNWTAISFPGGFYVSTVFSALGTSTIVISPYPPGRTVTNADVYKGLVVGVDSGAQANTTLVPTAASSSITYDLGTSPACIASVTNTYTEAGAPLTSLPGSGYTITTASLILGSYSSASDAGGVCLPDFNQPSLPGFIQGERVTITQPE